MAHVLECVGREDDRAPLAGCLTTTVNQTVQITDYTVIAGTGVVVFTLGGGGLTWPVDEGFPTRVYVSLPCKNLSTVPSS